MEELFIAMREFMETFLKEKELEPEKMVKMTVLYPKWEPGKNYKAGEPLKHENVLYKVVMEHTSQEIYPPGDGTESLYAKVLIPDRDVVPEWEQPLPTNLYMKGDKVSHNGFTWISLVDNNSWEPGVEGTESLWQKVED